MTYRVSEDVLSSHLPGETVLLHLDTKSYFRLNATASRIWQLLEEGLAQPELVARLCSEFEVTPEGAAAHLLDLIPSLLERKLISASGPAATVPDAS